MPSASSNSTGNHSSATIRLGSIAAAWAVFICHNNGESAIAVNSRRREIRGKPLINKQNSQVQHPPDAAVYRSEEHTSELQSRFDLVCRLLLEKKKQKTVKQYIQMEKKHTIVTTSTAT